MPDNLNDLFNQLEQASDDDFQKLIDSLPSLEELNERFKDKEAVGRELTEEEKERVVPRVSPRRYGTKGETWAKERLEQHGATLNKNKDELKEAIDRKTGIKRYYRAAPTHVDFDGSIPLVMGTVPMVMEVKTFQGNFSIKDLSEDQCRILSMARRRGELATVMLVRHEGGTIMEGWLFPWRGPEEAKGRLAIADWQDLMETVKLAAEEDKRFKGKSVRPRELALFGQHHICKYKRRWQLCAWLQNLLPRDQPGLF